MAAFVPALKVIGVALSAKSAYDSLKEGNYLGAVLGIVGVYGGISSLAKGVASTGAAGVTQEATSKLSEGALASEATRLAGEFGKVSTDITMGSGATGAATAVGSGMGSGGFDFGSTGKTVSDIGSKAATATNAGSVANTAGQAVSQTGTVNGAIQRGASAIMDTINPGWESKPGLIKTASSFMNDNPEITRAGMNLAAGYMQGKGEEEERDYQEQLYQERRDRMGNPGDISSALSIQWNPHTKRYERLQ